jgi:hypothetical protein
MYLTKFSKIIVMENFTEKWLHKQKFNHISLTAFCILFLIVKRLISALNNSFKNRPKQNSRLLIISNYLFG